MIVDLFSMDVVLTFHETCTEMSLDHLHQDAKATGCAQKATCLHNQPGSQGYVS